MDSDEHKEYHRKIFYVVALIIILLFGGAWIFSYIEKIRYIDALYFSAATMTTIGYGDITPKTDLGKIFIIIYAFIGVGIVLYGLSLLTSHFVEEREELWLTKILKAKGISGMRKSKKALSKIMKRFKFDSKKF